MILLDANILLYAYSPEAIQHQTASKWVEDLFHGTEVIGLCWPTIWGFVRIGTNPRAGGRRDGAGPYFEVVKEWLQLPAVLILRPGPRHLELVERMVLEGQASGPSISDAVLAALAIENGATLASTDRDFSRFPGLKWINPLD